MGVPLSKIKVSFAIGKLDSETIGISSRSLGEVDVSAFMKQLGGGGHHSNAAAQVKEKSIKEVKQELIDVIEKEGENK